MVVVEFIGLILLIYILMLMIYFVLKVFAILAVIIIAGLTMTVESLLAFWSKL